MPEASERGSLAWDLLYGRVVPLRVPSIARHPAAQAHAVPVISHAEALRERFNGEPSIVACRYENCLPEDEILLSKSADGITAGTVITGIALHLVGSPTLTISFSDNRERLLNSGDTVIVRRH